MEYLSPCSQWLRARKLGIQVGQDLEELLQLYEHLPERTERVLEIGTQHGGWLFMLASVLSPPAQLCGVDQVGYPAFEVVRREIEGAGFGVTRIIRPAALARPDVDAWLGDAKLDVLHLDASHDDGVCEEWNLYSPLVRPGGIVAIHDVRPTGPHAEYGAHDLFRTLGENLGAGAAFRTHICLRAWPEGLGIGVVEIPKEGT